MSKILTGEYKDFGSFGLVDDEYLIPEGNNNGVDDGDNVLFEEIEGQPGCYKVISLVDDVKNEVNEIIEGYFKETSKGYGFIKVLGEKKEIFVPSHSTLGANSGDKVRAVLGMYGEKKEALITEIIEKNNPVFIGEVIVKNDRLLLELESGEIVRIKNANNIKKGNILSVFLEEDIKNGKKISIVKEVLGDKDDLGIQTVIIAARNGARIHFPKGVLDEANSLDGHIDKTELEKREDLRDLFTVTIDGSTAKDKDDAISIKSLDNGDSILYVSIADVTHYVKEDFEIDNEALLRGTSLYFGDKVVPMIPERLSNDICSLNPNTDKATVTCEIYLNSDGSVDLEQSKFYNSIIKSNYAITYEEVDNIFSKNIKLGDNLMFGGEVTNELIDFVKNGFTLKEKISKVFKNNGKLNINSTETKIVVDENKKPIGVEAYPKYNSNELIENFMVIANNVIPQLLEREFQKIKGLEDNNLPFLHRTHGKPNDGAIEKLKNILEVLEIDFEFDDYSPKSFAKLLNHIKGDKKEKFLAKKITRTLEKAIYTNVREGHFGLALEYYSHFTSPIRRYPDLQIHRIIKEILAGKFDIDRYKHYRDILKEVAEHSTIQEEMSEKNESDVNKYLGCELLKDKVGEKFEGYIDDIDGKKITINLENTISGIINLSDNSSYISEKLYEGVYKIIHQKTKKEILLGDEISVLLEKVDLDNQVLYFKLDK